MYSYLSEKLEVRPSSKNGGHGVFARQAIPSRELLVVWGGQVVPLAELDKLTPSQVEHSIQVEEDLFLVTGVEPEPADYVNHSCNPNAGLRGQIALVARRDIEADEEVCFDYAMSDGSPYDEFACNCGEASCRGRITGNDWRIPVLWDEYAGFFSPYLQRRIDRLRAGTE